MSFKVKQFLHDLESPLLVLDQLVNLDLQHWGSQEPKLMLLALGRIKGLANSLSGTQTGGQLDYLNALQEVVLEKEVEHEFYNFQITSRLNSYRKSFISEVTYKRIVSNLINNSVDALKLTSNPKICIFLQKINGYISIIIKDNGAGISLENLNLIKEGKVVTTKPKGSGLGLSYSRSVLKENGGRLEVNSRLGIGTEVSVIFPEYV